MKIDFSKVNTKYFDMETDYRYGSPLVLITPKRGECVWSKDNLMFRSMIVDVEGNIVSTGFPKFFNYGESPEVYRQIGKKESFRAVEKLDGSLLTVSRFGDELIIRTRGSFTYESQENAFEIPELQERYKSFFDSIEPGSSTIFEWITPNNQIVIPYSHPDIKLIGRINHSNFRLSQQEELNDIAQKHGIHRPRQFSFNSFDAFEKMISDDKLLDIGISDDIFEGFVVYYGDDQLLRKCKTAKYLTLHRFREHCDDESIIDIMLENNLLDYNKAFEYISTNFDYECAVMAQGIISRVADGLKEISKIRNHMEAFVGPLKSIPRKDAAAIILQAYGNTNRAGFVFALLDGKEWSKDVYKKLLFQILKN